MAKKPNKILMVIGICMMVAGFLIILFGLPFLEQTMVSAGPVSADIPTYNATMIIIGSVLIVLGLGVFGAAYKIGE